jgi:hypothetical protein
VRTTPPWFTVTLLIPATTPAKVTVPDAADRTAVPTGVAKSTPQWPPYAPTGAKPATTGPATGGVSRQVGPRMSVMRSAHMAMCRGGAHRTGGGG